MSFQPNTTSEETPPDAVWLAEVEPSLHAQLATSSDAPARARALVSGWCETFDLDVQRCQMLRLLVSELVTNAVIHPHAPRSPVIVLAASMSGGRITVTVTDTGTGPAPHSREPDPATGGYGLYLLDRETLSWGADDVQGTRVWFEL
jgi:anti-sigma regulatory factor (Ser/Thr protein kinase)